MIVLIIGVVMFPRMAGREIVERKIDAMRYPMFRNTLSCVFWRRVSVSESECGEVLQRCDAMFRPCRVKVRLSAM